MFIILQSNNDLRVVVKPDVITKQIPPNSIKNLIPNISVWNWIGIFWVPKAKPSTLHRIMLFIFWNINVRDVVGQGQGLKWHCWIYLISFFWFEGFSLTTKTMPCWMSRIRWSMQIRGGLISGSGGNPGVQERSTHGAEVPIWHPSIKTSVSYIYQVLILIFVSTSIDFSLNHGFRWIPGLKGSRSFVDPGSMFARVWWIAGFGWSRG